MEENLKTSIFNPKDKLNESTNFNQVIYLGYVPNEKKALVKKNNCFYDKNIYRWYTYEGNIKMIQDFSKRKIDFWDLMNDLGLAYDKEEKCWYTYESNEKIDKKHFL